MGRRGTGNIVTFQPFFNATWYPKAPLTLSDKQCWTTGTEYAEGGVLPSLVAGANIAGFIKVANAMRDQGDWW